MSLDHKSTRKSEIRRVKSLGGFIQQGRIFGRLMITRSFGDFELKIKHDMEMKVQAVNYVTCEPDIRFLKVNFETDIFLLMASDGVFDKMTSQEACDFILKELRAQPKGQQDIRAVARKLADHVIYEQKVKDNATIILVLFSNPQDLELSASPKRS